MNTWEEAQPIYLAYIGLGSNMGEREQLLVDAMRFLVQQPGIELADESPLYETDPVGYVEQDVFLNQVIAVRTTLPPDRLYRKMAETELLLGRTRDIRWGPRTIDLDLLLLYRVGASEPALGSDMLAIDTEDLTVPHPRMRERAFVLIPLLDVISRLQPAEAVSLERHLDKLEGKAGVRLWKKTKLPNV